LSLTAIVQVIIDDDKAIVGKRYQVRTGVTQGNHKIHESLSLDIFLHTGENIEQLKGWYRQLYYDPEKSDIEFTDFSILVKGKGYCFLAVDFYYERCWLKTMRVEFEAVDKAEPRESSD
jgi:hypothetical protein